MGIKREWHRSKVAVGTFLLSAGGLYGFVSMVMFEFLSLILVSGPVMFIGYLLYESGSKKLKAIRPDQFETD